MTSLIPTRGELARSELKPTRGDECRKLRTEWKSGRKGGINSKRNWNFKGQELWSWFSALWTLSFIHSHHFEGMFWSWSSEHNVDLDKYFWVFWSERSLKMKKREEERQFGLVEWVESQKDSQKLKDSVWKTKKSMMTMSRTLKTVWQGCGERLSAEMDDDGREKQQKEGKARS